MGKKIEQEIAFVHVWIVWIFVKHFILLECPSWNVLPN